MKKTDENLSYSYDYVFDACKQQGLTFYLESLAPSRRVAILLIYFELLIVCLEKEQFGELAD